MAIGTQITTFANVAASSNSAALVLDADREYVLTHNGLDVSGGTDTSTIYFSVGPVTASLAEASDKLPLITGKSHVVGPGLSSLNHKTASGAPTFTITAGPKWCGNF